MTIKVTSVEGYETHLFLRAIVGVQLPPKDAEGKQPGANILLTTGDWFQARESYAEVCELLSKAVVNDWPWPSGWGKMFELKGPWGE